MDMNQNNHVESDEIYLSEIFNIVMRNIIPILLIGLLFATTAFSITKLGIKKQYVSSGTLIVNSRRSESEGITSDEIRSAQNLASVFTIVIKSEPVMSEVIRNLSLEMDTDQLARKVTVNSVDQTQVMKISVKTEDPKLSSDIANEILKVSPDIIVETVEAGSVKLISPAHTNKNPVSPNVMQNTLVATILGFMLSAGGFILLNILDKTFKTEEDIEKYLGIPLLGVIPNVESVRGGAK